MLGQPEQPEHKGLIPRSLEQIFKSSQILEGQGWKFKMQVEWPLRIYRACFSLYLTRVSVVVQCPIFLISTIGLWQASMLEIYNETIRDLLVVSKPDAQKTDAAKLQNIKHDPLGNTYIADLTLVEVSNWKEVSTLLRQAAQSRLDDKFLHAFEVSHAC